MTGTDQPHMQVGDAIALGLKAVTDVSALTSSSTVPQERIQSVGPTTDHHDGGQRHHDPGASLIPGVL